MDRAEAVRASGGGPSTSDYADMSNENRGGIPVAGIPRLPGAGSSARGQSGPKVRPKGVADGHGVNIPRPAWRVRFAVLEKGSGWG